MGEGYCVGVLVSTLVDIFNEGLPSYMVCLLWVCIAVTEGSELGISQVW